MARQFKAHELPQAYAFFRQQRSALARICDGGDILVFVPASAAMHHPTAQINYEAVRAASRAHGIEPLDSRRRAP